MTFLALADDGLFAFRCPHDPSLPVDITDPDRPGSSLTPCLPLELSVRGVASDNRPAALPVR